MLDLIIRGADVVDGTGRPAAQDDVGVHGGRIVEVGRIEDDATRTLEAHGLVVAPGFVDIHTHYDAQLMWDPMATPSPLHGITTVVGGNCGFTIAPLHAGEADYLLRMLARVEGIPVESLREGTDWRWTSFGEWLGRFEGAIGVNAGFLVGHSTVRRIVMGTSAGERAASEDEISSMERLVAEAIEAGALGFSSSQTPGHYDGDGEPIPSRRATPEELVRLAAVAGRYPGTQLEFIPTNEFFSAEHVDLMIAMSSAADRPLNWNVIRVESDDRAGIDRNLGASDRAAASGACLKGLVYPDVAVMRFSFTRPDAFVTIPGWQAVAELPPAEKAAALADPEVRRRLRDGARSVPPTSRGAFKTRFADYLILETAAPQNEGLAGRSVGEIAGERGADPLDVLFDIVVADGARTAILMPASGDDAASWAVRADVVRDGRAVVGASDAGAHLDMQCGAAYPTSMLAKMVRQHRVLELEEAVRQLTDVPARLYGLRERGRIAAGYHADLVVFDPARVATRSTVFRRDLPGGAARVYAPSDGIPHVFVNGVAVVDEGALTNTRSGEVLRSGVHSRTVTAADGNSI